MRKLFYYLKPVAGMMTVGCSWGFRGREGLTGADHILDTAWELAELFA